MWPLWLIVIALVGGVSAAFWFTRAPRPARHRKRPLARVLALGLLQDAIGRVEDVRRHLLEDRSDESGAP